MIKVEDIRYTEVREPFLGVPKEYPELPNKVFDERLNKVVEAMKGQDLDFLIIYGDREHYGNFHYLAGFEPRFEEALFVLDKEGRAHALLGNECIGMAKHSRVPAKGVLYQAVSLPNQDMDKHRELEDILSEIGINHTHRVGVVGWKLIYPVYGTKDMFDVPAFMVDSIRKIVKKDNLQNASDLFIHPEYGLRVINNADEIAYFEFGATYASDAVQQILLNLRTGLTEIELSQFGTAGSLPTSCFPKVLSGERIDVNMASPISNKIRLGDRFQVTMGLIGGQTNRRGFAAYCQDELPAGAEDWLERYAKSYFAVAANWYELVGIGVKGSEIYDMVEKTYPKSEYNWFLNPGHLIDIEEWMSSPIYKGSQIEIKSGMLMQMDIIPFLEKPYVAPDFEDGIAIADKDLREELRGKYPEVYRRIESRRKFMSEVLNIKIKEEILPLSNIAGLYRPFMLNKDKALVVER